MARWCLRAGGALLLSVAGALGVAAQTLGVGQNLPTGAITPLQAVPPRQTLPSAEHLLGLIRTTIIAIDQANKTGNYTVLRDLSAPDFRNANDSSRLGLIFQVLREKAIDFVPLLQIPPEVIEAPGIDRQGLLRLAGFFPTEPLRVNFDLSFQSVEGRWRPYTISVYLAQVEAAVLAPTLKRSSKPPTKAAPSQVKTQLP